MQKCTLALGCFWKPEENFKNKPGIIDTEVGDACLLYTADAADDA